MDYRITIQDVMDFAAKKINIPGWKGYIWESTVGGSVITGAVPGGVYSRGKKKGQPRFDGSKTTNRCKVVVSDDDAERYAKEYEEESGICWNCEGTGKVWAGWSVSEGTKYIPCKKCEAKLSPPAGPTTRP